MVQSYSHSPTITLMTCAFHGERVYAEYLVYLMTLIVIFFRYMVSVCNYIRKFVAVHYVLLFQHNSELIQHNSKLIHAVANCGIRYDHHNSLLGHNALIVHTDTN